jgi:hypothetical protein
MAKKSKYMIYYKNSDGDEFRKTLSCNNFWEVTEEADKLKEQGFIVEHYGNIPTKKQVARTKRDLASFFPR